MLAVASATRSHAGLAHITHLVCFCLCTDSSLVCVRALFASVSVAPSYGYITNTKVKLVVVLQDCTQDVNMKQWFRDLHTLYLSTVCNPFSDMQAAIQNPTFEQNIQKLVKNWFYVERK